MADYIADELKSRTKEKFGDKITKLIVGVDETVASGAWLSWIGRLYSSCFV